MYLIEIDQTLLNINNMCKKCGNNIIFKETKLKNNIYELTLSCNNEKKKTCGTQFIIHLPKTKDIETEINTRQIVPSNESSAKVVIKIDNEIKAR